MKRLYIGLAAIALLGYSMPSMSSSKGAIAGKLTGLMNKNMSAMSAEQYYAWKQEVDSLLNRLQGSERMGFERRIPALQAKLSDDVVNQILAEGVKKNKEIDNMPMTTPEEQGAQIEAFMNWIATDPGLVFVGKKSTYDDDSYRKILKDALDIATVFLLIDSKQADEYTNSESQKREEIKNKMLLAAPYFYNGMKAIIKRVNPSVISQLISTEQDTQKRKDIIEALDLIKNMKSEQEITNYMLNRFNELDTTPQAMESDADKAAKQELVQYVNKAFQNLIDEYTPKSGIAGLLGLGKPDYTRTNEIIKKNVEELKRAFNQYDYETVLRKMDELNHDNAASATQKASLYKYIGDIAKGLIGYYNRGMSFLGDKISTLQNIVHNAEHYHTYYAGSSSSSSSSSSSEESSRSSSPSSSTIEEPVVEAEPEEPGYTERYSEGYFEQYGI